MKKLFMTTVAAVLLAGAANAASIAFTENQGLRADGNAVLSERSVVGNMTDGDIATFYSLGIGGTLEASIAPDFIANASVIEVTFGNNAAYPEAAAVYLGSGTGGTLLGELFNIASGLSTTSTGAGGSSITVSANTPISGRTSFFIDLGTNVASSLTFLDTTSQFGPFTAAQGDRDGFDINELSISAVPLPAAGFMLIAGLAGLIAVGRRKQA